MRIFAAGIGTESNTFAAWPTGRRGFEESGVFRGDASVQGGKYECMVMVEFRARAEAGGHEFAEGLLTFAQPSGPTVHSVYAAYRDEIIADLKARGPFDVVLLFLHGAMVSTECDDCEGDLIAHVRAAAGPEAVIGVELDPHCHLTDVMVETADVVILAKEYPHDDFVPRAAELYDICARAAAGEIEPTSAVFDCRMVGFYPTTREPMAGLVERVRSAEKRPGVLSLSIAHGFPWGDTPDTGTRMLAVTDGDPQLARSLAEEFGREIYALRDDLLPRLPSVDEALNLAAGSNGRAVLADTADNAGGGAPSDNTVLLAAILERGLDRVALGPLWDPVAASVCAEAGVGARFRLRLGGKTGPVSGDPLDLVVTVRAIREDHAQTGLGGSRQPMGLSAWLEVEPGVHIVVNSVRTQAFHPDLFTNLGIDLAAMRLVVVKSSQHFDTGFRPIADLVVAVGTPGAIQMDFAGLPYRRKRDLDFHPRVADPLG
ncbi:MAG TPA: M81 family metallopeptidase [Phenylobacterium sp.]|nr:M81 family metallopeptidase [Phenylobacterium sp.]